MAKRIDAPNEYLGNESSFDIGEIGNGPQNLEVIDRVVTAKDFELERFMAEPVTIMVHDSNDANDVDLVDVSCNGVHQFLERGRPQTIKRCYVERLARAKRTTYSQNLDDRLGEAMNNMKPRHALKYPFSVIEDKNPKGSAWLQQLLAERV